MVAYTAAFLAAANLLALAQAAPAQPVCQAVITVITGSPIWVPRASATGNAGWGAWPSNGNGNGGNGGGYGGNGSKYTTSTSTTTTTTTSKPGKPSGTWTTTTTTTPSSINPISTITLTSSSDVITPTFVITTTTTTTPPAVITPTLITTTTTTTTPAPAPPAPTCDTVSHNVFGASGSGDDCVCDYTINCNRHSPYGAGTSFWEQTSGQVVDTLQDCLDICAGNSACTAVVWSNQDGESASDYKRCWQTSGLPQPDSDGYGQLSYKGSCSGSCSNSYTS